MIPDGNLFPNAKEEAFLVHTELGKNFTFNWRWCDKHYLIAEEIAQCMAPQCWM